jgi:hypothetical protein
MRVETIGTFYTRFVEFLDRARSTSPQMQFGPIDWRGDVLSSRLSCPCNRSTKEYFWARAGTDLYAEWMCSKDAFAVIGCTHYGEVYEQTEAQQLACTEMVGQDSSAHLSPNCEAPLCCNWAPCGPCEEARIWDDPMDRLVDGLAVSECLKRFSAWMRNRDMQTGGSTIYWCDGVRMVRPWDLTHDQLTAARSAWSASLRAKQAEAVEKQRSAICVDDDRWDP